MIYYNENLAKKVKFNNKDFIVVLDFDKTITTEKSTNSWTILESEKGFCKEVYEKAIAYLNYYAPIEIDYNMSLNERMEKVIEWYNKNIDLFYQYNLTEEILYRCIDVAEVKFRDGAKEFFKWCHDNNIIVVIVSAGIKNVIDELLKRENCYYDNIYLLSNSLKFQNGKMQKFEGDLIHTYNKNMDKLPNNIKEEIKKKNNILLFGDLIEDIGIVDDKDLHKTLLIGFLDSNVEENLNDYKTNYDIVLTGEDANFNKAVEIINLNIT